ncbi:hypothetical protein D3C71_1901810 [compost metagenome]
MAVLSCSCQCRKNCAIGCLYLWNVELASAREIQSESMVLVGIALNTVFSVAKKPDKLLGE